MNHQLSVYFTSGGAIDYADPFGGVYRTRMKSLCRQVDSVEQLVYVLEVSYQIDDSDAGCRVQSMTANHQLLSQFVYQTGSGVGCWHV